MGRLGRLGSRVVVGGFVSAVSLGLPPLGPAVIIPRTDRVGSVTVAGGPTPPPTVTLLAAGAQPRQPLRLMLLDGEHQSVSSTLDQSVSSGSGPAQREHLQTPFDEDTAGREPSGAVDMSDQYGQVVVSGTNAKQLRSAFAGLSNAQGGVTVSTRNEISGNFLNPSNGDPTLAQFFDQLSSQASQEGHPLPLEPVGPGARWRVNSSFNLNGINLQVLSTYRLVARTGNVVRLDVQQRETTSSLQAPLPGVPPNADVRIVINGQGSGSEQWDLGGRFPLLANLKSRAHIEAHINESQHRRTLTLDLSQSLHETASCCIRGGPNIHPNETAAYHAAPLYEPVAVPSSWSLNTAAAVPPVPGNTTCDGIELDYNATDGTAGDILIYEVPVRCAPVPPDSTVQAFGPNSGFVGYDPVTNRNGARVTVGKTRLVVYTTLTNDDIVKVFSQLEPLDISHLPANTP